MHQYCLGSSESKKRQVDLACHPLFDCKDEQSPPGCLDNLVQMVEIAGKTI